MKHQYTFEGQPYTLETTQKKKLYFCHCVELPQFVGQGKTARMAMQACLNSILTARGLQGVKVTKRVRRVVKPRSQTPKKKPWWQFW